MPDEKFSYEIIQKIGVLSTTSRGWTKQLNLISWNGRPAKFDIREWSPDGEQMGKGITLSTEEMKQLRDILNGLEL